MENRKNTILLTIIAVATLLVAVVGATFAYFTAQGGGTAQAQVNVTTGTPDSASFGTWTGMTLHVDPADFAQGAGDKSASSTGSASFTANSEAAADLCYNVGLDVTTNDFEYTTAEETPELVLKAVKNGTTLLDNVDITEQAAGANVVRVPNAVGGTDYEHKIHAAASATETDSWTLTVTFKNLDSDQNNNTAKTFTGAIKFTKVDCA